MTREDFIAFIEGRVLPEVQLFASSRKIQLPDEKSVIVSWGHYGTETEFGANLTHHLVDKPTTDALRIFFLKKGNKIANINLPQLIFSLSPFRSAPGE